MKETLRDVSTRGTTLPVQGSGAPLVAPSGRTLGKVLGRTIRILGSVLGTMGAVAIVNAVTFGSLNRLFGLVPRTTGGLAGILLHPLLHANAPHVFMNAIGVALMGGLVLLREERDFWRVTVLGVLVGGCATWLIGRPALHIGASGVVFAYLGYLLTTGWFDRKFGSIVLSLAVAAAWGSMLVGLSPFQRGISWELHLFGFIGGVLGAWMRRRSRRS